MATEEIELYPYEIQEREKDGRFREIQYTEDGEQDSQKPVEFIEQHTRLDLDGDDYPEPYIVTVYVDTKKVVRIVPDFTEEDVEVPRLSRSPLQRPAGIQMQEVPTGVRKIARRSYFVHYQFSPGADGKFFGQGLGTLLEGHLRQA